MRITIDFHDNEIKMSAFLTDKYAEILKQMGANQIVKQPRKGPYDVTAYQTSHLNGGAIMGDNPGNSALNRYLQSWDVPNLFVMGASAFPQNAGYNPTGTVGALAYWRPQRSVRNISKIRGRLFMPDASQNLAAPVARAVARCCAEPARCRRVPAAGIDKQNFNQIEHGRYLTVVGDCAACHTLPGSGHDFAGGRDRNAVRQSHCAQHYA